MAVTSTSLTMARGLTRGALARRWLPIAVAVGTVAALAVLVWVAGRITSAPSFAAGVAGGAFLALTVAYALDTEGVLTWWKGALGEYTLVQDLTRHRPDFHLFGGLLLGGEVDLVAIGPSGVFVFEAKLMMVDEPVALSSPRVQSAVRQAKANAKRVARWLGQDGVDAVTPVVFIMDHHPHDRRVHRVGGVQVMFASDPGWADRLGGHLLAADVVAAALQRLEALSDLQAGRTPEWVDGQFAAA